MVTNIIVSRLKDVEVVGTAENVKTGIEIIRLKKPHLVLLDIQMPDGTGFDLLNQIKEIDFKVIFITAFQKYAVKAFTVNHHFSLVVAQFGFLRVTLAITL